MALCKSEGGNTMEKTSFFQCYKGSVVVSKSGMRGITIVIQACLIFSSIFAGASSLWRDDFQSLNLIGEGTLKVFVWELYDLRLHSETSSFSWENRFVLEFDYKRDLKKEKLVEASLIEMRRQKGIPEKEITNWEKYLEKGIKPVQKGTKAAVEWTPDGKVVFHYEGTSPVTINDEVFARSFVSIWLGQETSEPALRSALLGHGE